MNRRQKLWIALCTSLAVILTLGAGILGLMLGKDMTRDAREAMLPALIAALTLTPALTLCSWLLFRAAQTRFGHMRVQQLQDWLNSHREQAGDVAKRKLRLLKCIRICTGLLAVFVLLSALTAACLAGVVFDAAIWLLIPCAAFAMAATTRIRFAPSTTLLTEQQGYISENDYPRLYDLTRRAAKAHGRTERIYITLTAECNAGIRRIGNAYSIELGAVMLGLYSEEELYCVLLHEFAHSADGDAARELDYFDWIRAGRDLHFLSFFTQWLYTFCDATYSLQFTLYRFAASLDEEMSADRAMAELGRAEVAASALLKLKYADLFAWEEESMDRPFPADIRKKIESLVTDRIGDVKAAIRDRGAFYNELIERELLARSASHPTLRMRLETLGVEELALREGEDSTAFRAEAERAARQTEERLLTINSAEDYAKYRTRLEKTVEAWEGAGRPVQEEGYPDTVAALRELGRVSEAVALCDRAIEELPASSSTAYALYIKGCYLLHRWDAAGIECIYQVIRGYSNYIDEGLDQVGNFCCMTGNRPELDRYRELAAELLQREKDVYSQTGVLEKGDRLSAEELPTEMEARIRSYVEKLDHGQIQRIYLLHKQITEDFFTSAMVLRFTHDASPEEREDTYHQIFLLLDAIENWQFSLFEYDEVKKVRPEDISGSQFYPTPKGSNDIVDAPEQQADQAEGT